MASTSLATPHSEPEGTALTAPAAANTPRAVPPPPLNYQAQSEHLLRALGWLALPVLAENFLNIIVGLNDAYLANHLPPNIRVDGTAAVGTIVYLLWFLGLFAGAVGTGATAIISRAVGAKHRGRANACAGQALLLGSAIGVVLGLFFFFFADFIARTAGLEGRAATLAVQYLHVTAVGAPFYIILLVVNACLRGAGDTRTPFLAMAIVNTVNVVLTWSLAFGYLHLPALSIRGIAIGTSTAYFVGALLQTIVLLAGLGKLRVRFHRLWLHRIEMARLIRLGIPSVAENALMWGVSFVTVHVVNRMGATAAAAHLNTLRIEALSYMCGFAFGVATATMVGQSLGMNDPARARKSAHFGYLLAGTFMATMGFVFIFGGHFLADVMSDDPAVRTLNAQCLRITGFCQWAFAGAIVFSSALRGAGDMKAMLTLNLISICGVRLCSVLIAVYVFNGGLTGMWTIFASEMTLRAILCYGRFRSNAWTRIAV